MKKVLALIAGIALVVWVVSWFRAPQAVAVSGAKEWPGGIGTLETIAAQFPELEANEASKKLAAMADTLPKDDVITDYIVREVSRGEMTIGEPPPLPDVSRMRELLLSESVVWEHRHTGVGDTETIDRRAMQMRLSRALAAGALVKARASDPAAWQDLEAVWKLARSLDGHPQMMVQTAAFSMIRVVNALSWKMPLPAPAWLAELQARDHMRPLLLALQYQSASYWQSGGELFPTKWLAGSVEHDRKIAERLVRETRCDVTVEQNDLGTDLTSLWRRAFRYRAEREAAQNALRIREKQPIQPQSVCSDGAWKFDGTTLQFSQPIPMENSEKPLPLTLRLQP